MSEPQLPLDVPEAQSLTGSPASTLTSIGPPPGFADWANVEWSYLKNGHIQCRQKRCSGASTKDTEDLREMPMPTQRNNQLFDSKIAAAAREMASYDERKLENIWSSEAFYLDVPKDAGHALLSVFPVSDIDRRKFCITSPSKTMQSEVLKLLADNEKLPAGDYTEFAFARDLGCRLQVFGFRFTRQPLPHIPHPRWILGSSRDGCYGSRLTNMALSRVNPKSLPIKSFDQDNQPSSLACSTYYQPTHRNFNAFMHSMSTAMVTP
ncbi:hypothetical protein BT96DRAFT_982149 [Gymnopus androsaceus JB14]|uniref:Uncharacterized protein n=1 Tax=Gymnopus androsaceus JB14 TaxID=1447944 RepID=A0A6A4GI76_9AGAR|nr:hypothetical protein BT96DRAFT_982149 [Gymnopus androsaceus JB14]